MLGGAVSRVMMLRELGGVMGTEGGWESCPAPLWEVKGTLVSLCPRFLRPTRSDPSAGHLAYILQNLIPRVVYVESSLLQIHCSNIFYKIL